MALSARLLGKPLLGFRPIHVSHLRSVTIRARPAEVAVEESHDERNMRLCRPQSPHLTIYKIQLTSLLSITHRFTGIILGGYATTFAVVSLLANKPMCEVVNNISQCYPNFFLVFKLGLIFPFTYHFFNGIRHLIWDTGSALTIKGVYISGYLMILTAIASAGGTIFYAEQLKKMKKLKKKLEKEELLRKAQEEEEKQRAEEEARKVNEEMKTNMKGKKKKK